MELLSQSAASGRFQVEERTNERTKASQTVVVVVVVLEGAVRHRGSRRSVAVFVAVAVAAAVGLARLARRTQSYNQMHCTQTNYHCRLPPARRRLTTAPASAGAPPRPPQPRSELGRSVGVAGVGPANFSLSLWDCHQSHSKTRHRSLACPPGWPAARASSYVLSPFRHLRHPNPDGQTRREAPLSALPAFPATGRPATFHICI